jgi:hypothetical protein
MSNDQWRGRIDLWRSAATSGHVDRKSRICLSRPLNVPDAFVFLVPPVLSFFCRFLAASSISSGLTSAQSTAEEEAMQR